MTNEYTDQPQSPSRVLVVDDHTMDSSAFTEIKQKAEEQGFLVVGASQTVTGNRPRVSLGGTSSLILALLDKLSKQVYDIETIQDKPFEVMVETAEELPPPKYLKREPKQTPKHFNQHVKNKMGSAKRQFSQIRPPRRGGR
ncbi:hypothetical protein LUCX_198 [Xanthomonas phage vB_XciM_LucasX]|nr:hypothetical protein LUCX_198 [Xanthomonas phage vB_XciM_LucasX]